MAQPIPIDHRTVFIEDGVLFVRPDFGATFASSQVDGSAARKCFHYP
jgi:hypothetical protein